MPKMTDEELKTLVRRRRDSSVKHLDDSHASDRREALRFYRGDNDTVYGDSGDGLSTVVSRDTLEAVESMLPGLIKPFVAGDEAVRFEPTEAADEEGAQQATEYINYLFANHNSAFRVTYDFAKDGLMFRLGVAKVVYEPVDESVVETFKGLDEFQYLVLDMEVREDKDAEIVDEPVEDEEGITVRVKRQVTRGTYRVYVIAPDEFLYEDRLASLEDGTFFGHKPNGGRSVGDLIAMGLDKRKCMDLQGLEAETLEADDRFGRDEDREQFDDDDLARKVTVADCYVRCDYDGTGTLQWRRVVIAGSDDTILLNEPVEDHPFVAWTPIPIPHRLVGLSVHDLVRDIQMGSTALLREVMNASYLSNRPQREVVEGQANIEDLLNPTVGGVVRVKAPGMIRDIPSGGAAVMGQGLTLIEHFATIREQRTGSTRYNQGMDANSLNKTATGISIIQNASTQRLEMISRQLAEAMMGIFRKMLGLVSRHADKKEVIRLRGEWVEMDPRDWKTGYDMSVAVGLGTGNRDQQVAQLTNLLNIDQQIVTLQGGVEGPILTAANIYEKLKRMVEAMGLKGVERYYNDPQPKEGEPMEQPPQQPEEAPVDPLAEAQAAAELEIQKARIAADGKIEEARIAAEADIVIAGIKAGFSPQNGSAAPDYVATGEPGLEGEDIMPPPVMFEGFEGGQ